MPKPVIEARDMNSRGAMVRQAEVVAIDAEARTVELSFSSEVEVPRWFGMEVLSHADGAADLTRLNNAGALLMDHNTTDQVGVIESASIDTKAKKGRALVRFGRGIRASEIFQDVVDKIRTHVSVGYQILAAVLSEVREDGDDVYTITSWLPTEISFVSVPADISVGVGRSVGNPPVEPVTIAPENQHQSKTVVPPVISTQGSRSMPDNTQEPQTIDADAVRRAGGDAERARVRTIIELGRKFGQAEMASQFASDGRSAAEFQESILEEFNKRSSRPLNEQTRDTDVGLSQREVKEYKFLNVIRALANPTNRQAQEAAAFEIEAGRAAADKMGKQAKGIMVPTDVLSRSLNAGTNGQSGAGSSGSNAIATELLASSFIDMLKNATTIMQLGRPLGGLVGNVDIPKKTARSQGYWVGEEQNATAGSLDIGQIALNPKTVAAYTDISRRMMQQSSLDNEALVRADLAEALGLTIDLAGYYGTGTAHQPMGISNYTGISAVAFAAANPTYAEIVQMETDIAAKNAAVSNMAYVVNATTKGAAKTTQKFPGTPTGVTLWADDNTMNGYQTRVTNQLAGDDVFFGNFSDLIIAMWGGLDLMVDLNSLSLSGGTRIVVFQDVDFALRRVESFCVGRHTA